MTVRQTSGTQDLPTGRTQSWGPTHPAGAEQGVQEEEQDAPRLITRTSEAEVAPKLKVGSRLAASMAKLAAAKTAGKPQPDVAPSAAAVPNPLKEGGKTSTIPDDVKRALLAKVICCCQLHRSAFKCALHLGALGPGLLCKNCRPLLWPVIDAVRQMLWWIISNAVGHASSWPWFLNIMTHAYAQTNLVVTHYVHFDSARAYASVLTTLLF